MAHISHQCNGDLTISKQKYTNTNTKYKHVKTNIFCLCLCGGGDCGVAVFCIAIKYQNYESLFVHSFDLIYKKI